MRVCVSLLVQARHGGEVAAWEQETGEDFVTEGLGTDFTDTAVLASAPLDQLDRAGSNEEVRVLGLTLVDRHASEKFGALISTPPALLTSLPHYLPIAPPLSSLRPYLPAPTFISSYLAALRASLLLGGLPALPIVQSLACPRRQAD